MATHIRCRCLHHQSPLPFEGATRNNKCFAGFCSQNGRISGARTVNSAIEAGQVGGCEDVEAEGDWLCTHVEGGWMTRLARLQRLQLLCIASVVES